ncbi:hypothetical protein Vi05172_g13311 [Venturia inaequalis]|nr:hypothetical protein Vi05172_g13311 [Venturia inaequalis]
MSDVAPQSLSSDPRDILYAFLGLLPDGKIDIHADYDSSLCDVLTNAAKVKSKKPSIFPYSASLLGQTNK